MAINILDTERDGMYSLSEWNDGESIKTSFGPDPAPDPYRSNMDNFVNSNYENDLTFEPTEPLVDPQEAQYVGPRREDLIHNLYWKDVSTRLTHFVSDSVTHFAERRAVTSYWARPSVLLHRYTSIGEARLLASFFLELPAFGGYSADQIKAYEKSIDNFHRNCTHKIFKRFIEHVKEYWLIPSVLDWLKSIKLNEVTITIPVLPAAARDDLWNNVEGNTGQSKFATLWSDAVFINAKPIVDVNLLLATNRVAFMDVTAGFFSYIAEEQASNLAEAARGAGQDEWESEGILWRDFDTDQEARLYKTLYTLDAKTKDLVYPPLALDRPEGLTRANRGKLPLIRYAGITERSFITPDARPETPPKQGTSARPATTQSPRTPARSYHNLTRVSPYTPDTNRFRGVRTARVLAFLNSDDLQEDEVDDADVVSDVCERSDRY